ncbi:sensor histidine kinase [Seonamhaeicola sp. MEBiC1930]|uniref:sensor histidine kinase n=1 Tax=Seonamhaeicola sp. MEBiC01930 TaxID=2976768 RepID=UPI00324AE6C4
MKKLLLLFFILNLSSVYSQNEIVENIEALKNEITISEGLKKLILLDSLSSLTEMQETYGFDSISKETISHALELDSINMAANQTAKLIHYYSNILGDTKEGLVVFEGFLNEIERAKSERIKASFFIAGADSYAGIVDYDQALNYYKRAKAYALKTDNQQLIGSIALKTGGINMEIGNAVEASKLIQEAIKIFTKVRDTFNLINAKSDISILYSQNTFYEDAKKERDEAIALSKLYSRETAVSLLYYNAAADYRLMGNQKKRILNLGLALKHNNSEYKQFYGPFFLCDLVIAYAENDSLKKAEYYYKQIENNPDTYSEGIQKEMYIEVLKQMALGKGEYKNAIKYGLQHLALKRQHQGYVEIMNAEKFLSDAFKLVNDNNNHKKHLINYYKIKDSITKVQNVKSLTYYQTLYETEKRDLKIRAQESDLALLDEKNKVKNQWMLFGGLGLLSIFGTVILWRSRNTAKKRQELQEHFSHELIQAQEEERTRISKDLHDSVGQQLTLIKKKAQNLEQTELSELTNTALEEVRSISRGLYPATLKQLGLSESIEQLLNDLDAETDMFFSLEIDYIDDVLNEEETLNFYRFIQEAVSNVLKHSQAKTLIVNIIRENNLVKAFIKDNGVGFNNVDALKHNSLGLKTIEERIKILKGSLSFKSKKGLGTTLLAQIPV